MYSKETERYISKEFPTLQGNCYLDHTGATLYAKSQIEAVSKDLCENIYGNPHSLSLSSRYCSDVIDQVRYRVLQHFNTNSDEYSVIFTSGATAALKLVAESFVWNETIHNVLDDTQEENPLGPNVNLQNDTETYDLQFPTQVKVKVPVTENKDDSTTGELPQTVVFSGKRNVESGGTFMYLQDNHTSVLGMRELAVDNGAKVQCLSHELAFKTFGKIVSPGIDNSPLAYSGNSLFVYPAQCNFSGVKYPLSWVDKVQRGILNELNVSNDGSVSNNGRQNSKWFCLLDAATYVSTCFLDFSTVKPDFVCISFYKMFGYPTGLGALLVRNSSADVLKRTYFGGGTVLISLSSEQFHVPRPALSDRFEDGTIPFLSIIALRYGFNTLQHLTGTMSNVTLHTFFLARYVHHSLLLLHHSNGLPVAKLYSDTDYEDFHTQGNIVNFNLLRANREYIGFMEVLNMANLHGIHLRTGCFCNPGACQRHLGLSVEDLRNHFQAGHVCGDERDLIAGCPTGSIRISFGYMSTQSDADKLLDMINDCFLEGPSVRKVASWWPAFRKEYREKFAIKSPRNGLIAVHTDAILDRTTQHSPLNDLEKHFAMEIPHTNCVTTQLTNLTFVQTRTVHTEVNDNSFKSENHDREQNHILENSDPQLHLGREVDNCMYSIDRKEISLDNDNCSPDVSQDSHEDTIVLSHIFLYPVKSCGAMPVNTWRIGPRGLTYDREWMIVTPSGVNLTQKQDTKLCLIRPSINLKERKMYLGFEGLPTLCLPLDPENDPACRGVSLCQSKVCGDRVQGWDCGEEAAAWLDEALGREGLRLIRQWDGDHRAGRSKIQGKAVPDEIQPPLSLTNQAQFLMLNIVSVRWLEEKLEENQICPKDGLLERFRSNLVVQGSESFQENEWTHLKIGNVKFVVEGPCTRCQMICIDQATGERTREPLRTLSAAFHGKMRFGIYLKHQCSDTEMEISVGDVLVHYEKEC